MLGKNCLLSTYGQLVSEMEVEQFLSAQVPNN